MRACERLCGRCEGCEHEGCHTCAQAPTFASDEPAREPESARIRRRTAPREAFAQVNRYALPAFSRRRC